MPPNDIVSHLRHLDIVSHLRHLEAAIAIAMLWGIVSQLQCLPPNVAVATQCLSVVIVTFGGTCRNSDALAAVDITTLICALHKNYFIKNYINV